MSTVIRTHAEHTSYKTSMHLERSVSCCALLFAFSRRPQKTIAVAVSKGLSNISSAPVFHE
jgi:hypothetical protein